MVLISGHGCGRYLIAFFSLLPFILLFYFLLIIFFISFFPQFFSFLGFFFLACLANYMLPASYYHLFRLYGCFFFPCFVCVCVLLYTIIPLNEFLLSRDIVFWWIGKTNIDYSFESGLLPCVLPEL